MPPVQEQAVTLVDLINAIDQDIPIVPSKQQGRLEQRARLKRSLSK